MSTGTQQVRTFRHRAFPCRMRQHSLHQEVPPSSLVNPALPLSPLVKQDNSGNAAGETWIRSV